MVIKMSQFTSYKESKDKLLDPVSDEFDSSTGEWNNITSFDTEQANKLASQKHTDIRSFYTPQSLPSYILYMNSKAMSSFSGTYVNNITTPTVVFKDENWTSSILATPVVNISTVSTTGSGIPPATTYYYKIVATNTSGQSFASQTVKITTGSDLYNTIILNWSAITSATGYKIYRNTSDLFTSGSLLLETITSGSTITYTDNRSASLLSGVPNNIVSVQSTYNNWYGLSLTCLTGVTTTVSSKFSDSTAINLSSYNSATDYITLSLPDFPIASTNTTDLAGSSIVFGNTANDYTTAGNIDSIPFNTTGLTWYKNGSVVTSWAANDELELRIPLSKLVNTKNQIVGVRFNIKNTTGLSTTFRCLAIRCASASWVYAPLDINTLWNVVAATPSRDGNILAGTFITTAVYSDGTVGTNNVSSLTVTGTGVTFLSTVVRSTLVITNSWAGSINTTSGSTSATLISTSSGTLVTGMTVGGGITTTATATSGAGQVTLTVADATGIVAGQLVTGTGIVSGTKVGSSYTSGTSIPLDTATNSSWVTGGSVTFRITPAGTTVIVEGTNITFSQPASASGTGVSTTGLYEKNYEIAGYTSGTLLLSTPATIPNGTTYSIIKKIPVDYPEWPLNVNNSHLPGNSANPWPFVYKSFNPSPVVNDSPEPIDGTLQIWFNSGSITQANSSTKYNSIDAYFRADQKRADQLVLNNKTQAALEEIGDFTKINDSEFETHQSDLNGDLQSALNGQIQKYLDAYVSTDQLSYLNFQIKWYASGGSIKASLVVRDDLGIDLYTFVLPDNLIKINTDYTFMPSLNNNSLQIKVFEIYNTSVGDPNHLVPVYDTGPVKDAFIYRTRGKIGWSASLQDGNAHIKSVRSRGMVYSQIKSSAIESYTPVKGVQIFVESNARKELISNITNSPFNVTTSLVAPDAKKNGSNKCYKISNAFGTWQGVSTSPFIIEDFKDIRVSFKLFTTTDTQKISAMLYSAEKNIIIPLSVPTFKNNQWSFADLVVEGENHLNGSYVLIIGEPSAQSGSVWWVDEISIMRDQLLWYARSYTNGVNEIGADNWVPTNQAMDSQYAGVMFTNSGNELQVKGDAKTPYVEISKINVVPKYATLGNFKNV